jgi:hypothetical protein
MLSSASDCQRLALCRLGTWRPWYCSVDSRDAVRRVRCRVQVTVRGRNKMFIQTCSHNRRKIGQGNSKREQQTEKTRHLPSSQRRKMHSWCCCG